MALLRFAKSSLLAFLLVLSISAQGARVDEWMGRQAEVSRVRMLQNISPAGAAKGVVVASPSRQDPDYFYHWVRDAGLVMNTVVRLYYYSRTTKEKQYYYKVLADYIRLVNRLQNTRTLTGLGEPKFNADGSAFNGPWGRPQNDGPALRAIALIQLASIWIAEGREELVRKVLYDGKQPTASVIKRDLEYVSHNWRKTCFDLWEEISGYHFYTQMAQRRAMLDGARLAYALGDRGAGDWYARQARELTSVLVRYWNGKIVTATLGRDGGIDYKHSGLDSAVILAALHASADDGFFAPTDDRILATFHALEQSFEKIYPVNGKGYPAVAIGRYPEDRYNGNGTSEGNPWVLTTLGFGELLHRATNDFQKKGAIRISGINAGFFRSLGLNVKTSKVYRTGDSTFTELLRRLRARGDAYIARAGFHSFKDGSLSEQINRHTGYMQGAPNLTWSHAAFLTAYWSRASRRR